MKSNFNAMIYKSIFTKELVEVTSG